MSGLRQPGWLFAEMRCYLTAAWSFLCRMRAEPEEAAAAAAAPDMTGLSKSQQKKLRKKLAKEGSAAAAAAAAPAVPAGGNRHDRIMVTLQQTIHECELQTVGVIRYQSFAFGFSPCRCQTPIGPEAGPSRVSCHQVSMSMNSNACVLDRSYFQALSRPCFEIMPTRLLFCCDSQARTEILVSKTL